MPGQSDFSDNQLCMQPAREWEEQPVLNSQCPFQRPKSAGLHRGLENAHRVSGCQTTGTTHPTQQERCWGCEKESDFLPCDTSPVFITSPKGSVSDFYEQVSETQRGTMFSESLQSGSNTAVCHLCQKSCGKAWHRLNQPPEPVSAPWAVPSSVCAEDVSVLPAQIKLTGKLLPVSVYMVEVTFLLGDICKDLFPYTPQVQIPPKMHII